ncbi:Retrovirus-related Pol polyprotein from transposon 17.6 [Vitis vinifera]|uniref:Retrovirus-related Pol polyprotein from transposon 17.6 n=1 Tax=Vitis vinifera TaxID=29760 RepID=A0A438G2T1_VITVI|nr:Retrovirus-related Pol polyprotein from transposon 17.6 [Vitis vinifera]
MDMMTVSQITGIVQLQPVSPFDMFGVSTIEVLRGPDYSCSRASEDDSSLFEGIVSPVEGASDLVDPPLSFDVLSGFVSRSDDVSVASFMDLSIFEYSVSCDRDVETVDFGTEDQPRELKIGSPLSTDERDRLIHSYLDVFAWSYEDMPGHSMLSFMDGFSGYNQILMAPEDMEKTAFITEWGTYCYRVMPFGLKNAGATYQRAATTLFHDMMHIDVEVYVDDMIVKSRGRADHLDALERFFERIRKFRLRLNPKKCTFGVTSGKLLGHMNQPTVWNDDCQFAFEKIKEYLLSPPVLVPPTPGRPLLLYLSVSDMALGSPMLSTSLGYQEIEALHDRVLSAFDIPPRPVEILFDRPALTGRLMRWLVLLTEFDIQYVSQKSIKGNEEFVAMTSLSGWCMYFDGAANQSGYGIGVLLVSPQGDHIPSIRPLLIELRSAPAYCCLIGEQRSRMIYLGIMIYQFLRSGTYPERSADGMLLLCLDRASADRVMREVHAGVCGPHMGGHMLARKIMRTGYFWLTMETDCCQFCQKCPECQIHGDLIHAPPSELHALTSPWPFSVWGIDIIGKVSPKSSSGHEFILVAIDYFTKWVEAASYARLTSARVASFISHTSFAAMGSMASDIIDLQHIGHRPKAVEAANKNIKRILRKMVETSRDWSEKLPFALDGFLRVALEQQISETEWAQARFDQLNLLDEKRLRARSFRPIRKMARAFRNGAYQCGSAEEVLCLRLWSQDGWPSFRVHVRVLWYPMLLGSWLICMRSMAHEIFLCITSGWRQLIDDVGFILFVRQISTLGHIPLSLRTSLHGFVEVEMDHIGFHQRSIGGGPLVDVHGIDLFSSCPKPHSLSYPLLLDPEPYGLDLSVPSKPRAHSPELSTPSRP